MQSIMTKIKNYAGEHCIVLVVIIKYSIRFFSVSMMRKNIIKINTTSNIYRLNLLFLKNISNN